MALTVTDLNGITKMQDDNFAYYLFPRAYFKADLVSDTYKQSSNDGYSLEVLVRFSELIENYGTSNIIEYLDYIAVNTTLYRFSNSSGGGVTIIGDDVGLNKEVTQLEVLEAINSLTSEVSPNPQFKSTFEISSYHNQLDIKQLLNKILFELKMLNS